MFAPILAESFWTLLRDPAHWYFELVLILLFDVVIGALAWPAIRRHIHRDVGAAEEHGHILIADLEHRLAVLEGDEEAILKEVRDGKMSPNRARESLGLVPIPSPPPILEAAHRFCGCPEWHEHSRRRGYCVERDCHQCMLPWESK